MLRRNHGNRSFNISDWGGERQAGDKHLVYDEAYLEKLGVVIDRHGKMPDVVVHCKDRNWLVLVEAVTLHDPVNLLRHTQLKDLFAGFKAGSVFVTAFLNRRAMCEYMPDIAWETEVWVADPPDPLWRQAVSRTLREVAQQRGVSESDRVR